MAEALVVPALVGAGIAELMHRVIEAAETATRCKQLCRSLQNLLKSLEPTVKHAIEYSATSPSVGPAHNWLLSLKESLEEAREAVRDCNHDSQLNPLSKYRMATRIIEVTSGIEHLCQQATVVALGVTLSQTQVVESKMEEMQEGLQRLELSITTRNALNPKFSIERAFYQIKTQVEKISTWFRNISIGKRCESSSMLEDLALLQPLPQFVFGLDKLTKTLQDLVLPTNDNEERCRCVGIWGPGGSGKTLLAQKVYNSKEVQNHFKGTYWLTVGQNPSIRALYVNLCLRFGVPFADNISMENFKNALYNEFLKKTKVLLVLDDVWSDDVLEWLQLAEGVGSVTLVTSRNHWVLQKLSKSEVVVNLLSEEDSWRLFCVHAFGEVQNVPQELEGLARSVAAECKGLPLALKVIGAAMVGKCAPQEWRVELSKLENSRMPNNHAEKAIFNCLELSVNDLDNVDPRSKECFLYFAAFPEDYAIEKGELFELWQGEQMVGDRGDDPEDDAYYLLGLLIGRSLIEFESHGKLSRMTTHFKIHDVLRDLALHVLGRNRAEHERDSLFRAGKYLEQFPSEWMIQSRGCSLAARRLSLMNNQVTKLPPMLDAPHLRTLLLNRNPLKLLPHGLLEGLANLMVLDLSGTDLKSLPNSIANLQLLVCLNLAGSAIKKLPHCLGKLKRLQRINLSHCRLLKYLPVGVTQLTLLKSLNLNDCDDIQWKKRALPMCSFISSSLDKYLTQKASLEDICQLSSLTDLSIRRRLPAALSQLANLRVLHLSGVHKCSSLPNAMQSLVELQDIRFTWSPDLVELPEWTTSFVYLRSLSLRYCPRLSHLPALDALPLLLMLDLSACRSLTQIPTSFGRAGAFPVLEIFTLDLCGLVAFPAVHAGAMPNLAKLDLSWCKHLKELPHSLELLISLVTLNLQGTKIENLSEFNFASFPHLQRFPSRDAHFSSSYPHAVRWCIMPESRVILSMIH